MSAALLLPVTELDPLDPYFLCAAIDAPRASPPVLYLDRMADVTCLISEEDEQWALQWRWNAIYDPRWKKYTYARRCHSLINPFTDKQENRTIWLHKEILARMGLPPSPAHFIGDHLNGNTLDNRRENLRWATLQQNNKNRHGFALIPQYSFHHMLGQAT